MKKILLFISLSISILSASTSVAFIKDIQNSVEIHRGNTVIKNVQQNMTLNKGDILKSFENSKAKIIFKDGTKVSIGSKSILSVDDYVFAPEKKKFNFQISLKSGNAIYESGKMSKLSPENIKFKVPTGTIGVRGTKFFVNIVETN